jgi:hypothetical protein
MSKKVLFVFVLAAALLTTVGLGAAPASAGCEDTCRLMSGPDYVVSASRAALPSDTSNAMFGPNFVTVREVQQGSGATVTSSIPLASKVFTVRSEYQDAFGPNVEDRTFNDIFAQ